MMTKKKRRVRTKRIYYGPPGKETSMYWTVRVKDARKPVTVDGSVMHALRGHRGSTIGCALSNTIFENKNSFPHDVFFAAVSKSVVWVVDKLNKAGQPISAVRYEHPYGHITDANDTGVLKKMVMEHPDTMDRQFKLKVPRKQKTGTTSGPKNSDTEMPRGSVHASRGALQRSKRAGLIAPGLADQLRNLTK